MYKHSAKSFATTTQRALHAVKTVARDCKESARSVVLALCSKHIAGEM